MPENILEKIIIAKIQKINVLKKSIGLDAIKVKIDENKTFINFKEKIEDNIMKNYNEEYNGSRSKILSYLIEHKMKGLIDSIEDF